jgi:Relaxase/Mobilisation nuclease domain
MLPKGNQRGGGQQLATHLSNSFDNELIEIADLRGAAAPDLHGAFAEWRAHASGTRCKKYLYSLSVNPDHRQGPFARELYFEFVRRVEERLGLTGQPRAMVIHVKYGREHCHVVWSRIDTTRMKAVQMSHDHQSLRTVAQEFAKEYGITLPAGMQKDRGKDRFKDRQKNENLTEKQQEERTGATKKEQMKEITAAWNETKIAKDFLLALEEKGYYLARGDSGRYVIVDWYGEIHSLAKMIDGAETKGVRQRLSEFPLAAIPDVRAAQKFAEQQRNVRAGISEGAASNSDALLQQKQRRENLLRRQEDRRDAFKKEKTALEKQHVEERACLRALQASENPGTRSQAAPSKNSVVRFVERITGFSIASLQAVRAAAGRLAADRAQEAALKRRHTREKQDLLRRDHDRSRIDAREKRSMRVSLRRALLRSIRAIRERGLNAGRTPDENAKAVTRQYVAAGGKRPSAETQAKIAALLRKPTGGAAPPDSGVQVFRKTPWYDRLLESQRTSAVAESRQPHEPDPHETETDAKRRPQQERDKDQ